jgi:hypothetical protein
MPNANDTLKGEMNKFLSGSAELRFLNRLTPKRFSAEITAFSVDEIVRGGS